MSSADAQKSEVHNESADASTSPLAKGDASTTRSVSGSGKTGGRGRDIPASKAQTIIISDQSDDGGPIVIQSQEPALNPPHVQKDKFPTAGVPDIDVPSDD